MSWREKKQCTACYEYFEKNEINFKPSTQSKDGYSTWCRKCVNANKRYNGRKKTINNNPEHKYLGYMNGIDDIYA